MISHEIQEKESAKSIANPLRLLLTPIDDFETFKETHGGRKGRMNHLNDAKKSIKSRQ